MFEFCCKGRQNVPRGQKYSANAPISSAKSQLSNSIRIFELRSMILSLGNNQINLVILSLIRIFAPENVDDVPSAAHHVAGCATQPDCRHACPGEHLLAP